MTNEDVATFVVALFPPILFIAELSPWVTVIGGTASLVWIGSQLYVSFRKERRATEEHKLKMAVLRKQLGEDDADKPPSEE